MLTPLTELPEWYAFRERFQTDIYAFATDVLNMDVTWQQEELFDAIRFGGSRTTVSSGHGCFGLGTKIMRSNGQIANVEDIREGDMLMGDDGNSVRNVQYLHRGKDNLFKFIYTNGSSHTFNESHVLCMVDQSGIQFTITVHKYLFKTDPLIRNKWSCYQLNHNNKAHIPLEIKTIIGLGIGDYYGFEIDGNHKFLGQNSTVLHNTGKTRSMAVVALWHLLCFENSVTMFTAPQIQQLRNQTWKEIALCFTQMKNGIYSWLCDYVKILTEKVFIVGRGIEWHVLAKTAPKNAATNIAGQHGDNLLIWADEASGVENAVMETLMGALTHKDNRMVLTSQPTKGSGFFYDTHHSLSYVAGGVWVNIIMNSELSPIVSVSWLSEQLKKYGSVDDPMYQVRVLGVFPDLTGEFIVPRRLVDAMYAGKRCIGKKREFGYIMCVDVGGGVGRDDSVIAIGKVSGDAHYGDDARRVDIIDIPLIDNTSEIDRLLNCIDEQMAKYPNITLVIDANGAGRGLAQALKARGIYFVEVHWGGVCFDQEAKETFHNKRSQAIVCMARAVGGGRLKIHTDVGKTKLQDQVSRIPYSFDDNSRWYVLPKESMRRRGLKSPDVADVLAFFFLDGVMYTPANESVYNKKEDEITASTSELELLAAQMLA